MLYIAEICAIATNATIPPTTRMIAGSNMSVNRFNRNVAHARRTSRRCASCVSSEPVLSPTRIIWRAAGGNMPDAAIGRARPSPRIIASRTVASFVLEHAVVRAVGRDLHRVGQRHAGVHERGEHAAEALDRDAGARASPTPGSRSSSVSRRALPCSPPSTQRRRRRARPRCTARITTTSSDMKLVKPSSMRVGSGSFASRLE